jgi:hypothetical protein
MRALAAALSVVTATSLGCGDSGTPTGTTTGTGATTGSTGSGGATTGAGGATSGTGGAGCAVCGDVTSPGTLVNGAITEASGIVASKTHPDVFYVENDSGDSARFFAIAPDGADLGTFSVLGANAVDWEDLSRGPCADPAKSCLFLADIGDNPETRQEYVVYRVEEPASVGAGAHTVAAEAIRFTYPDGSHNAEALFVDPSSGAIHIVTKNANESRIYRLSPPFDTTGTTVATYLGAATVPDVLPLVTGADMRRDGRAILLRTYSSVWYFAVAPGQTSEAALAATPCLLPTPTEMQGEAVAWTADGAGYVTVSEGASPELHAVACR